MELIGTGILSNFIMPQIHDTQTPLHLCRQVLETAEACEVGTHPSLPSKVDLSYVFLKKASIPGACCSSKSLERVKSYDPS